MTVANAIKKLEKNGFKVTKQGESRFYIAERPGSQNYIQFLTNGYTDDIATVDLRRYGNEDDPMRDYHAGTFCDNITQAIRLANN